MPDTPRPPDDREQLEEEAVEWIVRLMSGEATDDDRVSAEQWRRQSRSHDEAFLKADRLWQGLSPIHERLTALDKSLGGVSSSASPSRSHATRRWASRRLVAVAAMVALVAAAFLLRTDLLVPLRADYRTGIGERFDVALPDGSLAHLNTNSAIAVQFKGGERRIDLLVGEAAFDVAKDPARPFIVQAGGGETRAVGTEFIVRDRRDSISIMVTEGIVTAAYPFQGQVRNARIQAAEQVRYGPEIGLGDVEPVNLPRVTAWRRGKLIFETAPLAQAIQEINRHRQGHILLLNSNLARHKVNGVFDLNRMDEAVSAIEHTLNLRAIHLTAHVTVWY